MNHYHPNLQNEALMHILENPAIKIEQDEEVELWYTSKTPSGIMCRVLNDRQVEYEGKPWSLSGLARKLTNAKNCVPGPHYFKYKGEWLNDIRARLGV